MASPPSDPLTPVSIEGEGEGGERRKEELIGHILGLQNALHDLTQRINTVKETNSKLKSENEASGMAPGPHCFIPFHTCLVTSPYLESRCLCLGATVTQNMLESSCHSAK